MTCVVVVALVQLGGSTAAVPSPEQAGEWSAPSAWPIVAVHMSLEPTGYVFALDGFGAALNSERLWDPGSGSFVSVPYGRNLFCAGHIQLADGRTLLVGGHINANEGLADTTIFNPQTRTYFRGPDMSVGRWYPTATELPDGRVLTIAGDNIVQDRPGADPPFSDASVNSLPSIYNPKTNTWTDLESARLTSPLYPFMFVLSDGRVFDAGPDKTTRILNPATSTWSTVGTSPIDGHSAVMYRPNKIMKSGTWADPDFNGAAAYTSGPGTAVIDMSAPTPAWRSTSPMANARSYHNMTLLPDGTVLASGGMTTSDGTDETKAVHPAEIWNPDTETWTTVASLANPRLYHSTALLLPDGRVLMAGGGALPGRMTDQKNAEIYSPPYLFKGPRPAITTAPSTANYGESFDVSTPNAAQIARVSLIRSPSVTHAFDMNQRFQFLSFSASAGKVTVEAPANSSLAPPGDYLLFLVDTNGVPSVGSFVRVADTTAPTAPSNLTAVGSPGQVTLSWTAASDDGGVAHYNVHRATTAGFTPSTANRIAQPVGTNYVNGSLSAGSYYYKVTAEDGAGNLSPVSNEASATVNGGPPIAAYGFDAGSGTTAADQSGNGNAGTITNATWSASGKFGKALSFNGTNASVSVPDSSSLDLTSGMTLEGWVNPNAGGDFRTLVVKELPGDLSYGLYSSSDSNRPQSQVNVGGAARLLNGTASIPAGTWTHLAATYDGTTQRLYVNGSQVSTLAIAGTIATSNSPLKIGGNSIWSEWFAGLIDEVRVYNRALSAAEIQADMNISITSPDAIPPSAPGTLSTSGGLGQVSLNWGSATDNVAVHHYNVHRGTSAGFTPSPANRIAQPTGTSYVNAGLAAGTYYYRVTAEDAAGNVGPASNESAATATADTTAPTAPTVLTATPTGGQVGLSWGASFDAGGIANYNVHRSTTPAFTPAAGNRIAQPTGSTHTDVGVPAGTYYYKVTAEDPAGNVSGTSNEATAVVQAPPPVAAYGFDAGSGTTAADQSGNGNTGTIANAAWSASGKFGAALSFNGNNASVTVADSSSLDLTGAMTLEGWVNPNPGGDFRTMVVKEQPGDLVYGLYSSSDTNRPQSQVTIGSPRLLNGTASIPTGAWTHLAATYDGTTQRLYVNGTQVSSLAIAGTIATSNSPLKIGGNSIWSEWFAGLIDEVRVYNRALSAAEIQADMNTSITSPDATPPSAPGTLSATGSLTSAQLSWGAATDNIAVFRYNVHRSTTAGFTPSAANRIAQPPGTNYTDNVAAGTYHYKVTAEDAAGNVGPTSNETSATVGDTVAPTAPGTVTATGAIGKATLSWGAATDNVGVDHYNVHRSTTAGFTPAAANRIAQPTGLGYTDTTAPGSYFYKVTAADAAGNVGPVSNEAGATVTADTTSPSAPFLLGSVTGGTVNLDWSGSTDDVGVTKYNIHRGTTSGFTPSTANRIAQPVGTPYADTGRPAGTYYYKVTAEDAAGNVSNASNEITATVADAIAPSAPTGLAATASGSTINTSWNAATDNIGVARYNVHRGTSAGFTPSTANRIAQPTGTSYSDIGLAPGTYHYKVTAEDAAGNVGPVSNTASAIVLDTTAPTAPGGLGATGGAGQSTLAWTAATDNVGVFRYNVHRSTTASFTPSAANRIAQPTGTTYNDTGLAAGTYYYKATAEDAAGNVSAPSNEASATVSPPPTVGLVAAYGLDAGSGTSVADQSGNGNHGTITNATWAGATAGRFGNALAFNGSNTSVSIPHSASLSLTTGMTFEAWVRPTTLSSYNTVVLKERAGYYAGALYANTDASRPSGNVFTSGDHELRGTAQLPLTTWTHLAVTYDGSAIILYVNGTQAGTQVASGAIASSTGPLKFGGNAIWGEWFNGLIDEVRVYNRARTAGEIQTDMNTSISTPDSTPPSAPGTLSATGGLGQIGLSWGVASDNVGVVKYNVHRSTIPGFTPSAANRIAQPTGTSYSDTGLAAGTYYYKVTAEDAAGNVGPAANEASATATADTTPPTVSITTPTAGATVSATVSVTANASDNGSVAGVQFKVDGSDFGPEDATAPYSVSWDTFSSGNGTHTLSAVARDGAGNTTPSSGVSVTVLNTAPPGLVGAWAFDEGSGTTTADQSGKGNNGTIANGIWTVDGKFNKALSFNGSSTLVTVADSATLDLTGGMTVEAWVKPSLSGGWRTVVMKEQPGNVAYSLYANTSANRPASEVFFGGTGRLVSGTTAVPLGSWSHLAVTFDGSTLRLYLNGTQVSQLTQAGPIATSNSPLRIGGNGVWGEHFNGIIDEVRVYNRGLSAAEIQGDMNRSVTPDTTPPTVTAKSPANGTAGINVGSSATATFSESMNVGSITSSTVLLKDASNSSVPVSVTYDSATRVATLTPQDALQYGATYTVTVKGGSGGVSDLAGNALTADDSWSFTTEASPPQVLVVTSTANRFGDYLGEILRNEGLNAFTTIDASFISPGLLFGFDVVVLGETPLNALQVSTLTNWVNAGGNLVAMRPDKQLATLLGLTDASTTLANAYLQVDTATGPGAGIVGSTIQFHGSADRYTLNGATSIATLYSSATTATANPAVTLRSVGGSGGQAAAFTYDLARSVVYTRQGNPAWAGQERDGVVGIRPDDMFYGARAGDVQPDWVNTNKIAIPQADEQQRLLVNLITQMERDKMPIPHFWYLPRGKKAVVLLSGDDHSPSQAQGGTASNFNRFKALSTPGCVLANWECVRASSYIYPDSVLTNAQAAGYLADGFEMALHPVFGSCPTVPITEAELGAGFDAQLTEFRARYTSLPPQVSSRTHCVFWPDWASEAKVQLARGIRMDANYYHYPGSWIGTKPGFLNGGGFPMRFADLDGTPIDVYQQNTNLTDETTSAFAAQMDALLDNALGPQGFYGAFGTLIHTDNPAPLPGFEQIVASAQARGVPLISYKQMLAWADGRNSSTIRSMNWNAGTFTFVTTVGAGANGLKTMLPTQGRTGTLSALACGGSPRAYTLDTIKGIQYAMFDTITGTCQASYS